MEQVDQPKNSQAREKASNDGFHDKLRQELVEYLLMALPIAIINGVVVWIMQRFFSQPWQALWFVVPLAILGFIAWKVVSGRANLKLGRPLLILLSIYTLIFCLAAGTELFDWKRSLVGYEQSVPRNFLNLNWAGDWRYSFASQSPPSHDLAIVLMPPPESISASRYDIARLIDTAVATGAKGLAFDFFLNQNADKPIDDLLCTKVKDAWSKQVPVYVGYSFRFIDNEPNRDDVASNLKSCLPVENQGHLIGYSELDGKIRFVPLYFKGDQSKDSLTLKVSKFLQKDVQVPDDGLLQFVKPQTEFPTVRYQELFYGPDPNKKRDERSRLRDKFLLVGEESPADTFKTAYGTFPGVVIHSFVIHSLRQNRFIRHVPWWSSFLMVFVCCYLVTLLFAQNWRLWQIGLMVLVISVLILGAAALAVAFWLVWVDAIYSLLAVWSLFCLLGLLRRIFKQRLVTAS